ncbi:hypothetical protein AVEN_17527-1 [Araneus ventricosus]|uniref:Uncharacterized protein n=1 Tax=Araneus ventricosus TaxID=182803 RepID=A0A4Y2HFA0_ARAVE|nr:hypothetical protein AVEN_17527-1 [Araneus ventricosus]
MEVPGVVVKRFKRTRKLLLNWTTRNMREFFHLKSCSKSQRFGHVAKHCKDVRSTCGSCADRQETRRCRSSQIVCVNCSHCNFYFGKKFQTRQKASEYSCSCYRLEEAAYLRTRDD